MTQLHAEHRTHDACDEAVRANQAQLASALMPQFDFIVCGAGAAGSVVAGRLAGYDGVRVLLLEAGGTDDTAMVADPNRWLSTLGSDLDWRFTTDPNPHTHDRSMPYSMGRVLGGGASINVATWSRGHKTDWDHYCAVSGDDAWSYPSVLALYRRIEHWRGPADPEYRGTKGPMELQPAPTPHPFFTAMLAGAEANGIRRFSSANAQMAESGNGCAIVDEIVRADGSRQSRFRSYVYPRMPQKNLTVLTGALVTRICFAGRRATGIEFEYEGTCHRADANLEVILSLGAVQTPKVLMQSGIGDEAQLAPFSIPVVQHLPGVGQNLDDHLSLGCVWEAAAVPLPLAPRSQAVAFWKTDPVLKGPNAMAYGIPHPYLTPENAAKYSIPRACWSISPGLRGRSRGYIQLTGSNASDQVRIHTGYLSDSDDLLQALRVLEMCREIGNSTAMAPFRKREVAPGRQNRRELESYIRDGVSTYWHQSGTAKMGRDGMSVVDSTLRVCGVDALRIADASILPRVTTGNTMAPCVVIGEIASTALALQHGLEK